MPAGNHKSERRTRNFRRRNGCVQRFFRAILAKETREQVCRNVINRVKRPIERERDCLRETRPDQETSDESGANSRRDCVNLSNRNTCLVECCANDRKNAFNMRSARNFGHDPAVFRMQVVLRRNNARSDAKAPVDNRGCGLIARTFNTKDARHARAW
jgi:hypothetical protein